MMFDRRRWYDPQPETLTEPEHDQPAFIPNEEQAAWLRYLDTLIVKAEAEIERLHALNPANGGVS